MARWLRLSFSSLFCLIGWIMIISSPNVHSMQSFEDKFQTLQVLYVNETIYRVDKGKSRKLQNLSNQTSEEGDYLDFHRCLGILVHHCIVSLMHLITFFYVQMVASHMRPHGYAQKHIYLITTLNTTSIQQILKSHRLSCLITVILRKLGTARSPWRSMSLTSH